MPYRACRLRWTVAAAVLFYATAAVAETAEEPLGWSGDAELGISSTSGNSDTRSINAKTRLQYITPPWRGELKFEALNAADSGTTTAERYVASAKAEYPYPGDHYMFGNLRYEDDRFSGYDYQLSESIGYGHRFVDRDTLRMDLEVGLGGRQSRTEGGVSDSEAILRGAGRLAWTLSETAVFSEDLLIESGSDNTFSESVSALKLKINGNLAMKLSLTVRHSSQVPADTEATDTVTSVNLVYDF